MKKSEAAEVNGQSFGSVIGTVTERLKLSSQQSAVVELLCQGLTDKEIANRLGLTENTVGSYLKTLFQRYKVHSRAALVALLISEIIQNG
jgi:DNA-binding NarL/FixJ family response regulator